MPLPLSARASGTPDALSEFFRASRLTIAAMALFSLVMNGLMLAQPIYMLQVYDRVLSTGREETLALLSAMAAVALLTLGLLDALRAMLMVRLGRWFAARLAPVLLANSVRARLQGDDAGAQPLRDLTVVQNFIGGAGLAFLFDVPLMPLFLGLCWLLHPELGMLAVGAAVLLFSLTLLNDATTRKLTLEANVAQIRANVQAETTIRNAEVVRAMGMLPAMVARWSGANEQTLSATQRASERSGLLVGMTRALRLVVQVAVLGLGALLVLRGEMSAGGMIAASILLGRALAPVEQAISAWKVFTAARIAYARIKSRLQAMPPEPQRTRLPDPVGQLTVEGVSFVPPGSSRGVLHHVSFRLAPGEVLAIIGPSASGKSTLCRLLVGLTRPNAGRICIDGADLGLWDPEHLGRFIGYLPQDVELFAGTVADNIARMQQANDADVVAAAQLAHAHEMILRLGQGYDTQIGDAGAKLSGGQRQRIGLARAVYGTPRLIVLDEPNANLDQAGEAALAGAVNELKQRGVAMLIVGHRPSTLAHADNILVLKEGRAELYGPRDAVLQRLREAAVATTGAATPAAAEARPTPAAIAAASQE